MKFGGTSVSSPDCWSTICQQAASRLSAKNNVLIVASALSGVTNLLSELADCNNKRSQHEIIDEIEARHRALLDSMQVAPLPAFESVWHNLNELVSRCAADLEPRDRALLLAHGELMSSSIGHAVLQKSGLKVAWQDARAMLIATGEPIDVLAARCGSHSDPHLQQRLSTQGCLHITQGFIASDSNGGTCLLGRGGSDTSCAYLAARLQASSLEIWTDVPGIFSADPRVVPDARLLNQLSYSEAQELASMGAKVLHPSSIQPVRQHKIPVFIKDTNRPQKPGTCITSRSTSEQAQVKGVVSRKDIILINMENPAMWHQAGFLADVFAVFKSHAYSVDLISTSESTVTVSLDPQVPAHTDRARMAAFMADLEQLCRVTTHTGCVSISLVGNAIRTILGRLSAALDVFQDRHVHLVTQSANDLNLTLVVDHEHADSLVRKLHQLLISSQADNQAAFGPSWLALTRETLETDLPSPWWHGKVQELQQLMENQDSAYAYHLDTARAAAARLLNLKSVSRVLYAMKANDHPDLLRTLADAGTGFECVSLAEVEHVLKTLDGFPIADLLFTPNFAPRNEYEKALQLGVRVTVDNSWALDHWPEVFAGQDIFLRLDLDAGYGHHKKVITSGADSKFGISLEHLPRLAESLSNNGTRVIGLHAHTGSGVGNAEVWREQFERFLEVLPNFPDVKVLDLGGGLGVPYRRGDTSFDLVLLDQLLAESLAGHNLEIWLEPGRYLVAESGVLLSRVTQLKNKGQHRFLGISTGMNSLIRPALYGAYHDIFNLTRLSDKADQHYRVVGPICESGDVLGESRFLPASREGDILLIATTGAYGRVMASSYNRRAPAVEFVL